MGGAGLTLPDCTEDRGSRQRGHAGTRCRWPSRQVWHSPPPPTPQQPSKAQPSPSHLLDVFGALVVDEDDDGVDVHVVEPLDGVGADIQQAVPVLTGTDSE